MTSVAVVFPYRGDGGGPREEAWRWCLRWWSINYPGWAKVAGTCPPGPWCKAVAVGNALTELAAVAADVLVVADADVVCDGVGQAVEVVTRSVASRWAVPHGRVYRLTEAATTTVLASGRLPDPASAPARAAGRRPEPVGVAASYTGTVGGGLVVLPRTLYQQVPLDPRFVGWGQEDESWGWALTVTAGKPWRGTAALWHLWHPPVPIGAGGRMTRAVGNPAGYALMRRYLSATTPDGIRAVLDEIGADRV